MATTSTSSNIDDLPVTKAPEGTGSVLLFYNPGLPINEVLAYDHPIRVKGDPRDNQPALFQLRCAGRGFIEVPSSITIISEELGIEQEAAIPGIYNRFMSQYRSRGCVLVEGKRHKARADDDHVADSKESAVLLGDKYFRTFLKDTCNEWFNKVEEVRASGGVPRNATGLYAVALKELGYADPADRADGLDKIKESAADSNKMQKQIDDLMAIVAGMGVQAVNKGGRPRKTVEESE